MAGGARPPSSGKSDGQKSVDFQINMIPMIDPLSVLISFLLMTAVWTAIPSKVDVSTSMREENGTAEPKVTDDLGLAVLIKASGFFIVAKDGLAREIELK